jgi:hypothetical protein
MQRVPREIGNLYDLLKSRLAHIFGICSKSNSTFSTDESKSLCVSNSQQDGGQENVSGNTI